MGVSSEDDLAYGEAILFLHIDELVKQKKLTSTEALVARTNLSFSIGQIRIWREKNAKVAGNEGEILSDNTKANGRAEEMAKR